jgi:hypothetical protein
MTHDQAAAALESMAEQRKQALSGDAAAYKLRKVCAVHAVELYQALCNRVNGSYSHIGFAEIVGLINKINMEFE